MYHNILIPIVFDHERDHSKGLELAARIGGPEAELTLLHVIERLPSYVKSYIPENITHNLRVELLKEMNDLVKDNPRAKAEIVTGQAGRAIIDYANANSVDLIVIKSHRPGVQDFFLGSTAGYVVRHAKCAVHVIR